MAPLPARTDFLVVGGGPAGSALAALLARAGRDVVVMDKDRFPRHKLCGEFLSPESQDTLRRVGCLQALQDRGPAVIRKARFSSEQGGTVDLALPGEGMGLSRYALDEALLEHARACGAHRSTQTEVEGVRPGPRDDLLVDYRMRGDDGAARAGRIRAGWVLAAHGRRSRLDRQLGRAFMDRRHPYLGLKRHHRVEGEAGRRLQLELQDHVEIHAFEGGYCGMSFVETGAVNVCMLLRAPDLSRRGAGEWSQIRAELLSRNPLLDARLDALVPTDDRVLAVAQVPFVDKPRAEDGVLFAGDAAGMIAPLAGDGQAMALSSAELLGDLLRSVRGRPSPGERARVGAAWDVAWRRAFSIRMAVAARLQDRLLHARTADRMMAVVRRAPGLAGLLVRLTRG